MKLYILRPITEWKPWYDTMAGIVVRAESHVAARRIAASQAGDEGSAVWFDPSKTTCEILKPEGKEGVVIKDFQAA